MAHTDLAAGYSNMSMVGYQSPDGINQRYFPAGHRFSSVSLRTEPAVVFRVAKTGSNAARLNEEAAQAGVDATQPKCKANGGNGGKNGRSESRSRLLSFTRMPQALLIIRQTKGVMKRTDQPGNGRC